jgi:tetratricopeptide (TPR) repeat protein
MKRKLFYLAILSIAVIPANARRFASGPFELAVYPARTPEPAEKYSLLAKGDEQADADALPLYEKAIQAMPRGRKQDKQIQTWLQLPAEQLPQKQVEEVMQKHAESLKLLAQAARCKRCNWPKWKPGTMPPDLSEYRGLSFLLELRARSEIVRGAYDEALLTMQTAFGLARHLGQAPTCTQAMVGTAIGGMMCKEVELFIKGKDSPNLYWAIANLPRPLADVKKAIESDRANLKDYNFLVRRQFEKQLKPAHDRMLLIAKRLDNNLNASQCVEAIRNYAATHDGRLPEKLSDISDLELPKDVMCDKVFKYQRTATGALLQSEMPKGGDAVDTVRYQVVLRK